MNLRALRCMTGAVAALAVSVPALADHDSKMAGADYWHSRDMAVQGLMDKGYSTQELASVLPLLMDLRDAQAVYGSDATMYNDAHAKIWRTFSDKVGMEKANAIQRLIEPVSEDYSTSYVKSERITRIESLMGDWDRQAAARIAAYGGDASTTVPATVTTTTTTTVWRPQPMYYSTIPSMSASELITAIQMKIAAAETRNTEDLLLLDFHRDLNATDLALLRDRELKRWW